MKTSTKLWLDKNVVGRSMSLLNSIVRLLGKILHINHSLNCNFKTIAICKYKGMGSIIQATPLIKTMRINYPNAKIIFVSSKENFQIISMIPEIDEIILINDKSFRNFLGSFWPFVFKLISKKIEVFIDLEVYSNFSSLISVMSIAKNRLGFYLNSKRYRLGNYTHMMFYNNRSPISETYLQFARMMKCKTIIHHLHNFENSALKSSFLFEGKCLDEIEYIVINPNASDLRIERRWDANNYIELINRIHIQNPSCFVFIIGSKSELPYVNQLLEKIVKKNKIASLAGKTNIFELIEIIKNSKIFITNDSGPMHIGFATRARTISLFGPCSPSQYGIAENSISIYENLYCSPCVHEFVDPPCRGDNQCMKNISVEKVIAAFSAIINKQRKSDFSKDDILYHSEEKTFGELNFQ